MGILRWDPVASDDLVQPWQRLSWPKTIGIGMQHIVAMFGATFLVPVLTGFPPSTTLVFSGIGTLLFLIITRNQLPSYLGSSFAVIAPITAATASQGASSALGGLVAVGALLVLIGILVHAFGTAWIESVMPPVVTGAIVALIGLNLAPVAKEKFSASPLSATVTLVALIVSLAFFRGMLGRMAIFSSVILGYCVALSRGEVDTSAIGHAAWFGLPDFQSPTFSAAVLPTFLPVVLVLVAENIGHVKSVGQMTGVNYDPYIGRAIVSDGVATVLGGLGGGSATTTYAENIGVMAATKVYSTAAYWIAGVTAVLLGLMPKVGAVIATIPDGVLGGITTALYGLVGILGVRIWVSNQVDFSLPINQLTAAVPLILGVADFTLDLGNVSFGGIAVGSIAAIAIYLVMRILGWRTRSQVGPELQTPLASMRE
ncbi:uracil-xanthine permease family protein [Rhodococcus sp. NPDC057529]|uniref:uracil-xanthine permease family protein n=1 Tax=Rhodococcus sp. NPDC057529 TaxID=3346158 RepID=UPI00366C28E7